MKGKRRQRDMHISTVLTLLLTLLLVAGVVTPAAAAGDVAPVREMTRVDGPDAETTELAGLTAEDQATIRDLIREAQYQFAWQVNNGVWAYQAPNRAHDLSLSLAADGFHATRTSAEGEPLWDFVLSLAAYGGQTFPTAIAEDGLTGSRERVEYHWSRDVVEWYVNSAAGIEHGLTLGAPPAGAGGATVELTFALRGSLTPELDAGGGALRLKDAGGETVLVYDQLAVYDATGRSLPSHMRLTKGLQSASLHLIINAAGAVYPLTVDPVLHGQVAKLTASDTEDEDRFGNAVAISGDTVVVGAYLEDGGVGGTDRGAAYVFERNRGGTDSWGQVRELDIIDPTDDAHFGASVAISGDTIVVGAPLKDNVGGTNCTTGDDCGAAYIFTRNRGGADNWGMLDKINAGGAAPGDKFGSSVAISNDIVIVGAPYKDGSKMDRGAAYLFERNQGGGDSWGQLKMLTVLGAADYDYFGSSVAISGDTAVVGAWGEDNGGTSRGAAYVFTRNHGSVGNSWGQETRLIAADAADGDCFGSSVAISGDTVVVGAWAKDLRATDRGAAYLFERNHDPSNPGTPKGNNWGQVTRLTASDGASNDYFGSSVAISVDTVVVGAWGKDGEGTGRGAAYLYERNHSGADNWGQAGKLAASDAQNGDSFGNSVAISDDTVIAGVPWEDGDSPNSNRGAAYLYVAANGQWQEVAIPRASNPEDDDRFGIAVAISGDTAIVGADWEDGASGSNKGAAYVIERNKDGADLWGQVKKLTASAGENNGFFGYSVAISGDIVVVGAYGENGEGTNRGAAYIFERNYNPSSPNTPIADNWGQVKRLIALNGGDDDRFGYSVAISDDTVIVGADWEEDEFHTDRGAAYIYVRDEGGADNWNPVKKLTAATNAEDGAYFGCSVAISGDTVVVGAYGEDGGGSDRGAAYVFERNEGPIGSEDSWGRVTKLTAFDPGDDDRFGYSVAISEDTAVVGAYWEDGVQSGDNLGAAYIYERNHDPSSPSTPLADNWGQVKKLTASDAGNEDEFGTSVSISGDTVVVGAHLNNVGRSSSDDGAAYIFERNHNAGDPGAPLADNWGQVTRLTASDATTDDYFGCSVAISGDTVVVGAWGQDGPDTSREEDASGTDRGAAYIYYRWAPSPEITVSPGSLAFGDQGVDAGPTASKSVTISNVGNADLHISSADLTGAGAAEFAIEIDSGEATLAPGATRTVQLSFNPSSAGAKSANLSIASDDDDEATVNVALSGNGLGHGGGDGDVWTVLLPLVFNNH